MHEKLHEDVCEERELGFSVKTGVSRTMAKQGLSQLTVCRSMQGDNLAGFPEVLRDSVLSLQAPRLVSADCSLQIGSLYC